MNPEQYQLFINEQRDFFEENIQPSFRESWHDNIWYGGVLGSGWLLSRSGRVNFAFGRIKNIKGLNNIAIPEVYQDFMKAMVVLSYRKSNRKASPQKLYAELLVMKRWYSALYEENEKKLHPYYLSTLILNKSFKILENNSNKLYLPDHAGTYRRLQEFINHYGFTTNLLEFSQKLIYHNRQNRTPNARKTKELIEQLELDEDELEKEKLITIRTFINVISLISLCRTDGEKIILNLLLLLIITGFRSTEAILLRTDSLIKQPILDPSTGEQISLDGVKQFVLGIKYFGAKGSGHRIHWVEPLAAPMVENIYSNVLALTQPYRDYIKYIREKNISDFLPKEIDNIKEDLVEIDDLMNCFFGINKVHTVTVDHRSRRRVIMDNARFTGLKPTYVDKSAKQFKRYYNKKDLNDYVLNLKTYKLEHPFNHIFNYEDELINLPFEEALFIHEYRSTNAKQALVNKTNIILFTPTIINKFFGNGENISIFERYSLLESDNEYSKLTSHIPRHNINTFLALSGLSEHLQAMLMGRVDIRQNQYYQHLALKQRKVTASILEKHELVLSENMTEESKPVPVDPIDAIVQDGLMNFSENLDLEKNLKMNLHTFDSKNEISSFIKDSFFNDYFEDIAESFNELIQNDKIEADSLVNRHAILHPLPFGSCMREITVHDCPKRLACQSGNKCGNFSLTGRKGELDALQHTLSKLLIEFKSIVKIVTTDPFYEEMLDDLRQKILYLSDLKTKALDRQNDLTPIPVFSYSETFTKLPTTLSELFAIEQQKIESKES
ncbi:hypothetical protein NCZ17_06900 [Acinetobacter modestus]|uniref:hypothetical protein n=1 Tax=Acinetobacter modestus TaxID=1776740 RepID=UPI00203018A4|nr:hypothetical protein [Acinetobacter modestus]MCM1959100.1 hypothetical protein [Acinetobacter modestus]